MIRVRTILRYMSKPIVLAALSVVVLTGTVYAAANVFSSQQVEAGTRSTNASLVSDASASGGSAVKFTSGGSPSCAGMAAVTHGQQITASNTGYTAWCDGNNQPCTEANMTVYENSVNASSLGSSATCVWLKGGITINAPITLTACKVPRIYNTSSNNVTLNYCTIEPSSPADWSLGYRNFTATRSQVLGSSDGVRYGGSSSDTLIENYVRVKAQDSSDHNDGVQMYGASGGGTILRNNIDARPIGGGGGANAAFFIADGATGTYEIRDNYFAGGGYTFRLLDAGYYRATGNVIEKNSYLFGPVLRQNLIPGAILEWSNNRLSDGTILN